MPYQLQRLNITHFQTQNARFIQKMFDGCKALSVVGFGSGVQNTLKAFRSRFPKGEWYLNNEGPFALLKLTRFRGRPDWLADTHKADERRLPRTSRAAAPRTSLNRSNPIALERMSMKFHAL